MARFSILNRAHFQLNLAHFSPFFIAPAPDEAPRILSVTPHTTTSVLIRWQVSRRSLTGCIVFLFFAKCENVTCGDGRSAEWKLHAVYARPVVHKKTTVTPELTAHEEGNREALRLSFTFMEHTCRFYRHGEVLVISSFPSGYALSCSAPGISPGDSPVDELSLHLITFKLN